MIFRQVFILYIVFWSFVSQLQGEVTVVSMSSGERLVGEISSESTEAQLILLSPLLGELRLPRGQILKIEAQTEMVVSAVATLPEPREMSEVVVEPESEPELLEWSEVEESQVKERPVVERLREFKAPDSWSGKLSVGINLSRGDKQWTESFVRGSVEVEPLDSPSFYRISGSYTYRETERQNGESFVSTDKYEATFIYRRSFLDDFFLQSAFGYRVDQIKGIDRELQGLLGIGYSYEPTENVEFVIGGGGGIEDVEIDALGGNQGVDPVLNLFQEFSWRPIDRATLVQKFNYYWNPEERREYNYVLTAAIRYRITDLLGFEISYSEDFDNDTGTGSPQDDIRWLNAIIVYF